MDLAAKVSYERKMMLAAAAYRLALLDHDLRGTTTDRNGLVEVVLLHVRNLTLFFGNRPSKDDVVASAFCPAWSAKFRSHSPRWMRLSRILARFLTISPVPMNSEVNGVGGALVVDILDRHAPNLDDGSFKAVGLAQFARDYGDQFGRIELISKVNNKMLRLDLQNEAIRDRVLAVRTSSHLKDLYEAEGT